MRDVAATQSGESEHERSGAEHDAAPAGANAGDAAAVAGANDAVAGDGSAGGETGEAPAASDGTDAAQDQAGQIAQLMMQIEELQRHVEQLQDQLLRSQADFANYRKRIQAEQPQWETRAIGKLALAIVPAADNLERALEAFAAGQTADPEALRQGVELTLRQLKDGLAQFQITRIEAVGKPFDPHLHEAVGQVPTDDVPPGHVVQELQSGYRQGDHVLRPSMVLVAKPASEA